MESVLLLANCNSNTGRVLADELVEWAEGKGVGYRLCLPRSPEEACKQIRHDGPRCDRIIVAGGDGTLHHMAEALRDANRPVGIVPAGTANDLCRSVGLPLDAKAACRIAFEGEPRAIDLGVVNGKIFFNVAHIGAGVSVNRRLSAEDKRRLGPWSYVRAAWRAVRSVRSFHATVRWQNNAARLRSIQLAVGNGRYYGGGMAVDEEAGIEDGILHLYSLDPMSLRRAFRLAIALRRGEQRRVDGVSRLAAPSIEVHTRSGHRIYADGEFVGRTPARFSVLSGALRVVVPAPDA